MLRWHVRPGVRHPADEGFAAPPPCWSLEACRRLRATSPVRKYFHAGVLGPITYGRSPPPWRVAPRARCAIPGRPANEAQDSRTPISRSHVGMPWGAGPTRQKTRAFARWPRPSARSCFFCQGLACLRNAERPGGAPDDEAEDTARRSPPVIRPHWISPVRVRRWAWARGYAPQGARAGGGRGRARVIARRASSVDPRHGAAVWPPILCLSLHALELVLVECRPRRRAPSPAAAMMSRSRRRWRRSSTKRRGRGRFDALDDNGRPRGSPPARAST